VTDKADLFRAVAPAGEVLVDVNEYAAPVLTVLLSEDGVEALRADRNVLRVEPGDGQMRALGHFVHRAPRRLAADSQVPAWDGPINWGLARVGGVQARRFSYSGKVTVGICDTGLASHPDLSAAIEGGLSFVWSDNNQLRWQDDHGHGTHVAGIVRQVALTPSVRLLALKVLDSNGVGQWADLINALGWVLANPGRVQVLNMSLGGLEAPMALGDILLTVVGRGIPVVAAAGNSRPWIGQPNTGNPTGRPEYPARFPGVVAVSNLGPEDFLYPSSCIGDEIYFTAPGVAIPSAYKDGSYAVMTGTSMAAPFVAATAALLRARFHSMTLAQLAGAAIRSSEHLWGQSRSPYYGVGLIRPAQAVEWVTDEVEKIR